MIRSISLLTIIVSLCVFNSISDNLTADDGWDAGAEMLIVRPYLSLDHGVDWYEEYDEADTEYSNRSAPQYGYEASPRIWLGYTGCHGFGLRTRWWSLDQESEVLETNS